MSNHNPDACPFSLWAPMREQIENTAFSCWVLDQEGVFDCRSRVDKIEAIIHAFAAAGEKMNDPDFQNEVFEANHLDDLEPHEIEYIFNEIDELLAEI